MHPIPISVVVTGMDASVANSNQLGRGIGRDDAPACIDERALGLARQFEGFLDLAFVALVGGVVAAERDFLRQTHVL